MKKLFFIFIFLSNIAFSLDLTNFEERQKILQDIKSVILKEESIAKAYEKYILDNYAIPTDINSLYTAKYLDSDTTFISDIQNFGTNFNSFLISKNEISYALKDSLKRDTQLKNLYESDTFRNKTYFRNNKLYFILEDVFAKHLFDLIKFNDGNEIEDCKTIPIKVCKFNNHIYIKPEVISPFKYLDGVDGLKIEGYLINYHIDKFKTGPIIITNDTSKYLTDIFNSIPKGALLYDTNGVKYLKTVSGIEVLK